MPPKKKPAPKPLPGRTARKANGGAVKPPRKPGKKKLY